MFGTSDNQTMPANKTKKRKSGETGNLQRLEQIICVPVGRGGRRRWEIVRNVQTRREPKTKRRKDDVLFF
jgi:hypothetical protein